MKRSSCVVLQLGICPFNCSSICEITSQGRMFWLGCPYVPVCSGEFYCRFSVVLKNSYSAMGERSIPALGLWRRPNTWHLALGTRDWQWFIGLMRSQPGEEDIARSAGPHRTWLGDKVNDRGLEAVSSPGGRRSPGSGGRMWLNCLNNSAACHSGTSRNHPCSPKRDLVCQGDLVHRSWVDRGTWGEGPGGLLSNFIRCQGIRSQGAFILGLLPRPLPHQQYPVSDCTL